MMSNRSTPPLRSAPPSPCAPESSDLQEMALVASDVKALLNEDVTAQNDRFQGHLVHEAMAFVQDKEAYEHAVQACPDVVEQESPLDMYLEYCQQDMWEAARRLAAFWQLRLELFGAERAFLPLPRAMHTRDWSALLGGCDTAILPPDQFGNSVIYVDRKRKLNGETVRDRSRIFWFLAQSATTSNYFATKQRELEEGYATSAGVCDLTCGKRQQASRARNWGNIVYLLKSDMNQRGFSVKRHDSELMEFIDRAYSTALCGKTVQFHVCAVDPPMRTSHSILRTIMVKFIEKVSRWMAKVPTAIHIGTAAQVQKSVSSQGINGVPVPCGGSWSVETEWPAWLAEHGALLPEYQFMLTKKGAGQELRQECGGPETTPASNVEAAETRTPTVSRQPLRADSCSEKADGMKLDASSVPSLQQELCSGEREACPDTLLEPLPLTESAATKLADADSMEVLSLLDDDPLPVRSTKEADMHGPINSQKLQLYRNNLMFSSPRPALAASNEDFSFLQYWSHSVHQTIMMARACNPAVPTAIATPSCTADTSAYWLALQSSPLLIKLESPHELFLEFCNHDMWQAANRLTLYWKLRLKVFGAESAFVPLTEALRPDDWDKLLRGPHRMIVLPQPDTFGNAVLYEDRAVLRTDIDCSQNCRLLWFLVQLALSISRTSNDYGKTRKTLTYLIRVDGDQFSMQPQDHEVAEFVRDCLLKQALCAQLVHVHVCVINPRVCSNASVLENVIVPSFVQQVAPWTAGLPLTVHSGSPVQVASSLHQHGFGRHQLPTECGGIWNVSNEWPVWLMHRYRSTEQSVDRLEFEDVRFNTRQRDSVLGLESAALGGSTTSSLGCGLPPDDYDELVSPDPFDMSAATEQAFECRPYGDTEDNSAARPTLMMPHNSAHVAEALDVIAPLYHLEQQSVNYLRQLGVSSTMVTRQVARLPHDPSPVRQSPTLSARLRYSRITPELELEPRAPTPPVPRRYDLETASSIEKASDMFIPLLLEDVKPTASASLLPQMLALPPEPPVGPTAIDSQTNDLIIASGPKSGLVKSDAIVSLSPGKAVTEDGMTACPKISLSLEISFPFRDHVVHQAMSAVGDRRAYDRAVKMCPHVVMKETPHDRFLSFAGDNMWDAALRLATYWKLRVQVFGQKSAFQPLSQSLTKEDKEFLSCPHRVILPCDAKGRAVQFFDRPRWDSLRVRGAHFQTQLKSFFVYLQLACEEAWRDTGNGDVVLVWLINSTSVTTRRYDKELLELAEKAYRNAMCARYHQLHLVCVGDEASDQLSPLLKLAADKLGRTSGWFGSLPRSIHIGSERAVLRSLEAHGLSGSCVPVSCGGKLDTEKQWPTKLSLMEPSLAVASADKPIIISEAGSFLPDWKPAKVSNSSSGGKRRPHSSKSRLAGTRHGLVEATCERSAKAPRRTTQLLAAPVSSQPDPCSSMQPSPAPSPEMDPAVRGTTNDQTRQEAETGHKSYDDIRQEVALMMKQRKENRRKRGLVYNRRRRARMKSDRQSK